MGIRMMRHVQDNQAVRSRVVADTVQGLSGGLPANVVAETYSPYLLVGRKPNGYSTNGQTCLGST